MIEVIKLLTALTWIDAIGWLAAIAGLLGAYLLAQNNKSSKWGFVMFLVSNCFWFVFGYYTHAYSLVVQQIGFTVTSCIGIRTWFNLKRTEIGQVQATN